MIRYNNLNDIGLVTPEVSGEDRYTVDFDALWELNPDIVAWIRFDEPSIISYPVVQGTDNEEYLIKTIWCRNGKSGIDVVLICLCG